MEILFLIYLILDLDDLIETEEMDRCEFISPQSGHDEREENSQASEGHTLIETPSTTLITTRTIAEATTHHNQPTSPVINHIKQEG